MEGLASSASGVMAREAPSKNAALSSIKEIDFRFKEENVQLAMIV